MTAGFPEQPGAAPERRETRPLFKDRVPAALALPMVLALSASIAAANQQQTPPPPAIANLKLLTLEQLSAMEVTTPSKEPQSVMRSPVAIFVITGEDIARSGATCIPEALRAAPGVEVARIDSNKWSIGIRGFGSRLSRSVLVLIDGRTVYSPLFAGTYWEVQDTYMADIDRIEVIRGPGGTIWGPNAVDGVINVITKSSKDTQGLNASASGGNFEQGDAGFRYGGGGGSDLTWRFYGKGFTRGPEEHPDHQNFDDWRAAQGGFRIDWNRSEQEQLTVQGDIYDEKAGERVNPTSYAPPYSWIVNGNAALSGGNVLARWKRGDDQGNDIQFQAYYDRTSRSEPNVAAYTNNFDFDYLQRASAPGRQQISWGLGARVIGEDTPVVVSGLQFLPVKRTDWLVTGFLQDEIGLVKDRLTLTVGTKLLRTNFTRAEPEPSARIAWTPSEKNALWAAYTHAVRTPSDAEDDFSLLGYVGQAAPGLQAFARFNPNPQFAPEQLNGFELGYRRLFRNNLYVSIASFLNHYHNLFSEDITGGFTLEDNPAPAHLLLPAQFRNDLYGGTKGVEVAPEWRPKTFWRLRVSYSLLNMHLHAQPGSPEVGTAPAIEGSSPRTQVTAQSGFDIAKTMQFDLIYRFVSALPGESIAAYSTGDARFAWRFRPRLEISVVGQNLFQPYHAEAAGDPNTTVGIVRSGYVKLSWTR
jgi:iron complex outermembrane receptor protein